MPALASPESALARWLAQGVTSRTHLVLRHTLETFFHPLGVEAEALEAEPFSALEAGLGEGWLSGPRWNPERFDRQHPAAPDFACLLEHPECFSIAVDPRGVLTPALSPAAEPEAAVRAFLEEGGLGWRAVRHTLKAAHDAETFLYAAAGLLLVNDPAAAIYARGEDAAFCAAVHARLSETRGP